ncbi:MAG: hypothetical protein SLAVMIC_00474 [uncultured marine phage]|uniref:Uncharacterized protein n=1 Tax=uncultured marine phage TaxID=707152 RepID=A0A8D9C8Z4_9VIRU|nr:MAG: hypothetical protein SLAVMIC_00474 [uncultured marine phage]
MKLLKLLFIGLTALVVLSFTSCCDTSMCEFNEGDDVEIKNKRWHDEATITEVHCGCEYTINYYSTLGVRRHRLVKEWEIEHD